MDKRADRGPRKKRDAVSDIGNDAEQSAGSDSEMKTAAQRKADERQRYKAAGLVAVTTWIHPEDRERLTKIAARMNARREPREPGEYVQMKDYPTGVNFWSLHQNDSQQEQYWADITGGALDAPDEIPAGGMRGHYVPHIQTHYGFKTVTRP